MILRLCRTTVDKRWIVGRVAISIPNAVRLTDTWRPSVNVKWTTVRRITIDSDSNEKLLLARANVQISILKEQFSRVALK